MMSDEESPNPAPENEGTPPEPAQAPENTAPPAEGAPAADQETGSADGGEPPVTENWRHRMANGSEDKLKLLDRYASEEAMVDGFMSARQKISSGEYQAKLSDDPSDEELSTYREANSIPQTVEDYEISLPEGFNFGEEDQPRVDLFVQKMHEKNATSAQVSAGLSAYAEIMEEQAVELVERDNTDKQSFEDALRSEYGDEYRPNMNIITNFIASAPEDVQTTIAHGRGPDGQALLNNVEFVRWISGVARELNPAATVIRSAGTDSLKTVNTELAELDKVMKETLNTTWHGSEEKKRHMVLLDAKSKIEKRRA